MALGVLHIADTLSILPVGRPIAAVSVRICTDPYLYEFGRAQPDKRREQKVNAQHHNSTSKARLELMSKRAARLERSQRRGVLNQLPPSVLCRAVWCVTRQGNVSVTVTDLPSSPDASARPGSLDPTQEAKDRQALNRGAPANCNLAPQMVLSPVVKVVTLR